MTKEIKLNPEVENELDQGQEQAEFCFTEMDLAVKAFSLSFGEDSTYDELSLIHTTLAYTFSNHINVHNLPNINMDEYKIPNSMFKDKDGETTDELSELEDKDKIHLMMSMLMNARERFIALVENKYFEGMTSLMIDISAILFQLSVMFDRAILLLNNKYSKLILNIK